MDRLDRDILKTILESEQSTYSLEKNLKKSNYATVWRHIKKMKNDGLLQIRKDSRRKNGKLDRRGTEKSFLTSKGLATLLIDGNLSKKELTEIGRKALQKDFDKLSPKLFMKIEPFFTDIFCSSLLELKPKVNLRFFDEKWFHEIYLFLTLKHMSEAVKKYRTEFEKEGIWATEAELQKSADKLFDSIQKDMEYSREE